MFPRPTSAYHRGVLKGGPMTISWLRITGALLILSALVVGTHHLRAAASADVPMDMMMMPDFSADRSRPHIVATSGQWPSAATSNTIVRIPTGVTVTISDVAATAFTVDIAGTLIFDPARTTQLTAVTVVIEESGTLRMTPRADVSATMLFADAPMDTTFDPLQVGHGLIGMGTARLSGVAKTPFVRLATEPHAGDTVLRVAASVAGWKAGDELVVPDSRPLSDRSLGRVDQSDVVTLSDVSPDGQTLTLQAPLKYAHPGGYNGAGELRYLPHVANVTRNLVFRSPEGAAVRGHTLFMSRADADVENASFIGLGRTKTNPLDETKFDGKMQVTHVGINVPGRYPLHAHHLNGLVKSSLGAQFKFVGNAIVGSPKFGLVIHDSHFGLVQGNVVEQAIGTGLMLETGQETGNLIDGNFITRVVGDLTQKVDDSTEGRDTFGFSGFGIWVMGSPSKLTNNVISDIGGKGIALGLFNGGNQVLNFPLRPGNDPRVSGQFVSHGHGSAQTTEPTFDNTEVYGATQGIFDWQRGTMVPTSFGAFTAWNTRVGASGYFPGSVSFTTLTLLGNPNDPSDVFHMGAMHNLTIGSADIENASTAIGLFPNNRGYKGPQTFEIGSAYIDALHIGVMMYSITSNPTTVTIKNLRFSPRTPAKTVEILPAWTPEGGDPTTPFRVVLTNYKGSGENYEVFGPGPSPCPSAPAVEGILPWACPVGTSSGRR
jgi:hypothetical protein